MGDPVKPETESESARVDENARSRVRRSTSGGERGAFQATRPDTLPPEESIAARTARGEGLRPATNPGMAAYGAYVPPSVLDPSFPKASPALDPTVSKASEVSGSRPRVRAETLTEAVRTTDVVRKPKKKNQGARNGALAAGALVLLMIGLALRGQVAAASGVRFRDPVPRVIDRWGGDVNLPAMSGYVQRVADAVAAPMRGLGSVKVMVAADPTPSAVALPGKQILLTVGVLRRLSNEGQLAALIAHLCSHMAHGDVERAFGTARGADDVARAMAAAAEPYTTQQEQGVDERAAAALQAAGYSAAALKDVFDVLGIRGGRVTPFAQQHPVARAALEELAAKAQPGRTSEVDYARYVLDRAGRTSEVVAPVVPNPKLPPPNRKPLRPIPKGGHPTNKVPLAPAQAATNEPPMISP